MVPTRLTWAPTSRAFDSRRVIWAAFLVTSPSEEAVSTANCSTRSETVRAVLSCHALETTDTSLTGTKCPTILRGTAPGAAIAGGDCASSHSRAPRSDGSSSSASAHAATSAENRRAGCGGHSDCWRSL